MRFSKLGQGLAVSAVSALAITGMALLPTPAAAVEAPAPDVRLISQLDGVASVRMDGDVLFGGSVTLTAEQLDTSATVSFEYNADPAAADDDAGWLPTGGFRRPQHGPFISVDWSPDAALIGTTIAVRAVAAVAAAGEEPGSRTYSTRQVLVAGGGSPTQAVSLDTSDLPSSGGGGLGGFFTQPYADSGHTSRLLAVSGTTSATEGTVALSVWDPSDAAFHGRVDAAVSPFDIKVGGGPFSDTIEGGTFAGALDITAFDAAAGDTIAVRAVRDSDSVVAAQLKSQTVTQVVASADEVAGRDTTRVVVRALDQDNRPIAGAEVRRSSDGTLVGYTDGSGQVTEHQANDSIATYYVNTTDGDAFERGTDVATDDVTTGTYVPVPAATEVELADGDVFDDREYAEGDIALQVVDADGDPYTASQEVSYALYPTGEEQPDLVTATTDEDGRVVVPFDPTAQDGSWTLAYTSPGDAGGQPQAPVTFVAGDAVLGLAPAAGTAASGGQITWTGHLTVEGEALPGRDLDLAYTRGTEQAPGTAADAGILLGGERGLTGSATSADDGSFSVTVADAVEAGLPAETGGRLDVTARGLGDTVTATTDFTSGATVPTPTPTPTPAPTGTPTPAPAPAPVKGRVTIELRGSDAGAQTDRLRVDASAAAAGERLHVHVLTSTGWRALRTFELDERGRASLTLRDHNGDAATRYRVRLTPNPRLYAATSPSLRLR